MSLGGGNAAGVFNKETLEAATANLHLLAPAGYGGVVYDVEHVEGHGLDSTGRDELVTLFEKSFKRAKELKLIVCITTSHSAPYAASSPDTPASKL